MLTCLALGAGCGLKDDLYLPDESAPGEDAPADQDQREDDREDDQALSRAADPDGLRIEASRHRPIPDNPAGS